MPNPNAGYDTTKRRKQESALIKPSQQQNAVSQWQPNFDGYTRAAINSFMAPQKKVDVVNALVPPSPPLTTEQRMQQGQQLYQNRLQHQQDIDSQIKALQNQLGNYHTKASEVGLAEAEANQMREVSKQIKALRKEYKEAVKPTDWDGRADLIKQLQELDANAGFITNENDAAALEQRRSELQAQLEQGDIIAGNGVQNYDWSDRARSVFSGAFHNIGSGFVNLAGTAAMGAIAGVAGAQEETGAPSYTSLYGDSTEAPAQSLYGPQVVTPEAEAGFRKSAEYGAANVNQRINDTVLSLSDEWAEAAEQDLAKAKNGLGKFGQAAVDIGENMIEMGFDAAVGAVTGGSSLASMFLRVAGSSAREARLNGATLNQQLGYGLTTATIEVLTEKMADGLAGIYGAGAADDIAESVIRRLSDGSAVGQTLLRALYGAIGEGSEEVVSDLLAPYAELIYNDKSFAETIKNTFKGTYDSSQLLYDFLIGAAIGMLGGGTSIATGQNAAANAENAQWSATYENMGEQPTLRQELKDRKLVDRAAENPDAFNPATQTAEQQASEAMQALVGKQTNSDRVQSIQNARDQQAQATFARVAEMTGAKKAQTVNGQPVLTPTNQHERIVYNMLTQGEFTPAQAEVILANRSLEMAVEDIGMIKLDGLSYEEKMQALLETYGNGAGEQEASTHESVPPSSQEATEAPPRELNTQENGDLSEQPAGGTMGAVSNEGGVPDVRREAGYEGSAAESEEAGATAPEVSGNDGRRADGVGGQADGRKGGSRLSPDQRANVAREIRRLVNNGENGNARDFHDAYGTAGLIDALYEAYLAGDPALEQWLPRIGDVSGLKAIFDNISRGGPGLKTADRVTQRQARDMDLQEQARQAEEDRQIQAEDRRNTPDIDAEDFDEDTLAELSRLEEQENKEPTKSWFGSLEASEPTEAEAQQESPETNTEYETRKAQQEADENAATDDYEQRRKDGKLTDEEKAEAKQKAVDRQGKKENAASEKIAAKLSEWGERWSKIDNETTQNEDGTETTTSPEASFAAAVDGYANGTVSAQELLDAYETLNSDGKPSYASLFYFERAANNLKRLAELEKELNYLEANGQAVGEEYEALKKDFVYSSAQAMSSLSTLIERGEKNFNARKNLTNEIAMNFRVEQGGRKGAMDKLRGWFVRIQQNPRLFFEWLGGFDKKNSKESYKLAQRVDKAMLKNINVRQNALAYFSDLTRMAGYRDFETGKTKGNVDIPGLGKISLNYELSLLRTLETSGAIEHILQNGAKFAVESDYYANRNNKGFGQTEGFAKELDVKAMGDAILEKEGIEKPTKEQIKEAREKALKQLTDALKKDVMSNKVSAAAYDASVKAMRFLARELNATSRSMYGYAFALGGNTYWPLETQGKGDNAQAKKVSLYDIEDSSFTHRRVGPSGKLVVRPFVETMSSYANRASIYAAFAELRSDLAMMDTQVGSGEKTFASALNFYGKPNAADRNSTSHTASEYYTRWLRTIDGDMESNSKLAAKLRSNLAQSSLMLNAGVALKQTPSYFDAAGEIDYDILLSHWKPLKSAKSYDRNPLLAELRKRTSLLESRKSGYNAVEIGEAADEAHSLGGKIVGRLPSWMTNWINKMDYRTVSNLAFAAQAQVERSFPDLEKGSNAYYSKIAEVFERAVLHSQPIYNAQYRAENLRSSNELIRSVSMFRTQQTQNFNQLAEAWGEYKAAKDGGDEAAAKEAGKHLRHVVAGQLTGSALFGVLQSVARLMLHKTKNYEDEDGELDEKKILGRLALDFGESVAATMWFGDSVAALSVDLASRALNKGKGTSEFYNLSESTTQLITDVASGLKTMVGTLFNPDRTAEQKLKATKDFATNLANFCGVPLGNAYNLINSAVMFYTDAQHKNVGNYDDMLKRIGEYSAQSESARASRTAEQALVFYGKGDKTRAEAALATLDFSSKTVVSAAQSKFKEAYIAGEISKSAFSTFLKKNCGLEAKEIKKILDETEREMKYDTAKEADKKTFDAVELLLKSVTDKKRTDDRPIDYYKMDAIIDTMLNDKQVDAVVGKQMGETYRSNYNVLRGAGMTAKKTAAFLEKLDTNQTGSLDQGELYDYFLTHKNEEKYVAALWNAQGYSEKDTKTWKAYLNSRRNMAYDTLAAENSGNAKFEALEEEMKKLKSDSQMMLQKPDMDKDMFSKILAQNFTPEETDAAVKQYISSTGRKYYDTLRGLGMSPSDAVDTYNLVDSYTTKTGKPNNGSISIEELIEFYKEHPGQEEVAIALYNSDPDRKYTWEQQKKKNHIK